MIIQNGYIQVKQKAAAEYDPETGYYKKPTAKPTWGERIPCQFIQNTHNNLGRVNGEHFTAATYQILIEEQQPSFTAEQVRLTSVEGREIGDFSVISVEPLEAVCETRIMV